MSAWLGNGETQSQIYIEEGKGKKEKHTRKDNKTLP